MEEQPIFIAENLPCQTGSMVEICFDVIIHGEKDHADTIAHIGLAPGTVAAAIQTMAGLPGIFLAGHFQKIAGMDRQDSGLRACLKSFDKREGKADKKGKQAGDDGECVNIQAISAGKSMKRYERI